MAKKEQKNELDKMNFEDTISKLEGIVRNIESGQTPLEQSLEQYEQGMAMIKHCQSILKKCEDRIEKLAPQDIEEDELEDETADEDLF